METPVTAPVHTAALPGLPDVAALPVPVAPQERVALLDALRGFALVGILIANLATFTFYAFMGPAQRAAMPLAGADFWAGPMNA